MKNILIVGANSKLAKRFIGKYNSVFNLIKLSREELDLQASNMIDALFYYLKNTKLDGLLFFASIYKSGNNYDTIETHLKINALSLYKIVKVIIDNELINPNGKFIFFTDGGTSNPKKNYLGYSISKDLLKSIIRNLAVNYSNYIFLGLDLGPVETSKLGRERKRFFSKSLLNIKDPGLGLINFIGFLLQEENFFSTGCCIDFTGGTYLKRC